MVLVISRWSDAIRSSRCSAITHHPSAVRCASWIRLQLNSSKTEVMWPAALSVDGVMVDPVRSGRDLSIYIDADLSMRTHVQ